MIALDNGAIAVSVICITYNHKLYIEDALKSIVRQKTNFTFEVVVHDDKSSDGTTEIIESYERKYPNLIKPIYENENKYSQNVDILMEICIPFARGKYIALCEGDDYWIDDLKLQKQYDMLEIHSELDMCACAAKQISENHITVEEPDIRPKKEDSVLTVQEVIEGGGNYLATASLFFRKSMFDSLMEFEKILCFDYTYQIKGALRGGIYYLDRKMVVYRRNTAGSWTLRVEKSKKKYAAHIEREIGMLRELDKETLGEFHESIERRIYAYTPFLDQLMINREKFIADLPEKIYSAYLWGLGMRGDAFQEFCNYEKINLEGVCDLKNEGIGKSTIHGYIVFDSNFVFNNSEIIFASNENIYNSLIQSGYDGKLINLQKYMPLS